MTPRPRTAAGLPRTTPSRRPTFPRPRLRLVARFPRPAGPGNLVGIHTASEPCASIHRPRPVGPARQGLSLGPRAAASERSIPRLTTWACWWPRGYTLRATGSAKSRRAPAHWPQLRLPSERCGPPCLAFAPPGVWPAAWPSSATSCGCSWREHRACCGSLNVRSISNPTLTLTPTLTPYIY